MKSAGLGKVGCYSTSPKLQRAAAVNRSNGKGRRKRTIGSREDLPRLNAINSQKLRVKKSLGEIYDIAGWRSIVLAKKQKKKRNE